MLKVILIFLTIEKQTFGHLHSTEINEREKFHRNHVYFWNTMEIFLLFAVNSLVHSWTVNCQTF